MYGRSDGDGPEFPYRFQRAGIPTEWRNSSSYGKYLASFDEVFLGLAPLCPETPFSRGKSFGKILAYLDAHVPVVASDACKHGFFFTPAPGVVSNEMNEWLDVM